MPHNDSNLRRKQFDLIHSDLDQFNKQTRPRKYDLFDIFKAVLYRQENGVKWRNLPKDFPK